LLVFWPELVSGSPAGYNGVILSGAGTSRSEVPVESKDPYVLLFTQGTRQGYPWRPHLSRHRTSN